MSTQNQLDAKVVERTSALLDKLQSYLPAGWGVMTWVYDRVSPTLEVLVFASHESTSETLRIVRATAAKILQQESRLGNVSAERWFDAPNAPPAVESRSELLVSSAAVTTFGAHDHVRVWSRGGLAGELIMTAGDGVTFATSVLMLLEREPSV